MTLTIVVLDKKEQFLTFLEPELCTLQESIEAYGLRTLNLEYEFQDPVEDKEYFKVGNKIWIQGDVNLRDCLYVINTEVKENIYEENTFTLELEEVLVELNYAPVFSQTELSNSIFHKITEHGQVEVIVDWNALNYWFGEYFNIGVIQQCISQYASRISITGTVNRMELLRSIEEETGNIFVTRYEKDLLNNTIHRYLDFLNPINVTKNWQFHMEYDFYDIDDTALCYDENGNLVPEDKDWEVTRFVNSKYTGETVPEDTTTDSSDEEDYDTSSPETYEAESQEMFDYEADKDYTPIFNVDPSNCVFRLVNPNYQLMNTDGEPYSDGDTALEWDCSTAGFIDTDYPKVLITLEKIDDVLGVCVNDKSYAVVGVGEANPSYLPAITELDWNEFLPIAQDCDITFNRIPDDSYFEIYDTHTETVLFRTMLNTEIGKVHEEVLDFGENLENVIYNIDESETYTAVSPILQPNTESSSGKPLSRSDVDTIINRWKNLTVQKGAVIPMIVEKINVTAASLSAATSSLGTMAVNGNYWIRPLKPNDNTDSTDKQYEFYRGIAYWRAPYEKKAGEMHITTDKANIEYSDVYTRQDTRNEKGVISSPKIGNTESSDEDRYSIYNQVATYLKEHETPNIDVELDVANLRGQEFNNYDIHDKIYFKLANTRELVTARVTKTTKEAHDIAKNTIEISNYRNINTIKTIQYETFIEADNVEFKYPKTKSYEIRLVNTNPDDDHDQYLSNKLVTFTLYKIENNQSSLTGRTYTKLTDAYGKAKISMKYDPGDYEMDIQFAGDEEYLESSVTININVGGTLPVQKTTTNNPRDDPTIKNSGSKTTAKTKKKTKTVKKYWTKCGLSPDKKHKHVVSIAQPSSADAHKYKYNQLWKTVFKNYCPNCKKSGYLRFDGGKANKCITSSTYGVKYKPGVPEHEVTCIKCDSDYCGVTGQEKSHGHISRLKTVKKPVKSSKKEFNKLVKGKLLHSTKKVTVKSKKVKNNRDNRKIKASGISSKVKKQALAIAKDKKGYNAARAIVNWIDKHIYYAGYPNFRRSPSTVLEKRSGNCCDVTRLCLQMLDVAGCTEYFKMEYVHVTGHVYARLTTKKSGKTRPVDCASDRHGAWGYICRNYRGLHETKTTYPQLPF